MVARGYGGGQSRGEEQHEGPLEDGEDLHFDGVRANILVVISCYIVLQDITIGGNWIKGTGVSPYNLSRLHNL